jgi:Caspase domain
VRLADVASSRAVLIGASTYGALPNLPAVRQNLFDLRRQFTDPTIWGLPEEHCTVLSDEDSNMAILDAIHDAAEQATDTLLVYYAGHGLLDQQMNLHLALPQTEPRRLYKSIQYELIRHELRDAVHCPSKVVILDCCFSGRAIAGRMGDRIADIADQAAVDGTWLVTASAENAPALSPPDEPHTAFTGELIRLLDRGIPSHPPLLDVQSIYLRLYQTLKNRGRPEPQQRIDHHGARIVIARNRWTSKAADRAEATEPTPHRFAMVPQHLGGVPTSLDALTRVVEEQRGLGRTAHARDMLVAVGAHREVQEVAATLARFSRLSRSEDVDAVLDGVAARSARDGAQVLNILVQLDAVGAVASLLRREAGAAADRVAELCGFLGASESSRPHLGRLLDTVVTSAAGRPDWIIDVINNLLLRELADHAEYLVYRTLAQSGDADIARIADALRETGQSSFAFRLYPKILDTLAARSPDHVATLVAEFRRHDDEASARKLAVGAAKSCRSTPDRADLLASLTATPGVAGETSLVIEVFAENSDDGVEELAEALRRRHVDPVALYLAALVRQPITNVLTAVNELLDHARPMDAFAILTHAGADRPASELVTLATGIRDDHQVGGHEHIFATVISRTDCTVELYELLHTDPGPGFAIFQTALIRQPAPVLLSVVVELVRSAKLDLGAALLSRTANEAGYSMADEIVRFADQENAEVLVLAAVGLRDLKKIIHALRQKGLVLRYETRFAARLLLKQRRKIIVVVVAALCTADAGPPAYDVAHRFAALPPNWLAFVLQALVERGESDQERAARPGTGGLDGPEAEAVTARAIVKVAADATPDRALQLVVELKGRSLRAVAERFLDDWSQKHLTGPDAFLLAAELMDRHEKHLSSRVLRNRAFLPPELWTNPVAGAISEVLHNARLGRRATQRYPILRSVRDRLIAMDVISKFDECLMIVSFPVAFGQREVVFTDSYVRHWSGARITYTELIQADGVGTNTRKVYLTKNGSSYVRQWSMSSPDDAEILREVLNRVRSSARGVRRAHLRLLGGSVGARVG